MNNHIPDAGKMVCPLCSADRRRFDVEEYKCGTLIPIGAPNGYRVESVQCLYRQRDQLRARVEELENWCQQMANMLEEGGWESKAQNEFRKYMEAKPEGLR
jgi:hypothetical protein